MSRPWMPLYIGDYRRDTAHLSTLQHGAYMLLIMHYWETGPLPADQRRLAKITGVDPRQWHRVWKTLRDFFYADLCFGNGTQSQTGNGANAEQLPSKCFRHKRIDQEREKAERISMARALAGLKGGRVSRGKTNIGRFVGQAIAKQTGTQSQSHSKPRTFAEFETRSEAASDEASKGVTSALVASVKAKG